MKKFSFNRVLNFVSNYFIIPTLIIIISSFLSILCKNQMLKNFFSTSSGIIFLCWCVLIGIKLGISIHKKDGEYKKIRWILPVVLVPYIFSLLFSFYKLDDASNICFIAGSIFFELYAIGHIVCNILKNSTNVIGIISMCFAFIFVGYISIYCGFYNIPDEHTLFNSAITLFSSIIGGSLTLGGVAWTIKYQKNEKNKELENSQKEQEKSKEPNFEFSMPVGNVQGTCYLSEDNRYSIYSNIKSFGSCPFKLKYLHHDGKKSKLTGSTLLSEKETFRLNFSVEDPDKEIKLEVENTFGNKYIYRLFLAEADPEESNESFFYIEKYEPCL